VTVAQLDDPTSLKPFRILMLGCQSAAGLSAGARENVAAWVRGGGLLIGFGVEGLDQVFGVERWSRLRQPTDDYTIAAHLEFRLHELTREVHPFLLVEQRLLILSDVELVRPAGAVELARLYGTGGSDLGHPAITWNRCGKGMAGYFAFDVAKTIWVLHQGRPLPPVPEGEYALRTPDLQVIGPNSTKVAYADELVHVIQNMMAQAGQPFIYSIPPDDGDIPDALLYYSGDEYTGPVDLSLKASDFMAGQGLPYHINISAEHHPMTVEQLRHIQDNGHEVSCYMWLRTPKGCVLNQDRIQVQSDRLYERFGFRPGSVLIGSTQWSGGVEPARWLARAGATADNTFVGSKLAGKHPLLNGPWFGFGFGTSGPFFFYEDHERGNERIDVVEQPIVCYELGHRASLTDSAGQREVETRSPEDVHEPIDRAVRYHLVMNIFYHPWYIVNCPLCRAAIEEILRYIDYKGAHVLHMANNRVADWWRARSRASVTDVAVGESSIGLTCDCPWADGLIVKTLLRGRTVTGLRCDGVPATHEVRREFGGDWLYVVIPSGQHRVEVDLGSAGNPGR
jgi:hypothetical protein